MCIFVGILLFVSLFLYNCANANRLGLSMANFDADILSNSGTGNINQNSDMDSNENNYADTVSLSGNTEFSIAALAGNQRASIKEDVGYNSISQTKDNNGDANLLRNHISRKRGTGNSKIILNAQNIEAKTVKAAGHNVVRQARDNNDETNRYYNTQ